MKLSTIEIAHILLWVAYKTPIWNSLLPHHIQAFQFLFLKGFSKHTSTFPQPQEEHWELLIYLIKIFAKYILYICMFFLWKPWRGVVRTTSFTSQICFKKLRRNCQHAFLMRTSTNWFSFFLLMSTAYLHSSKLTVIEFGDGCSFGHIFLSALRTNSLRFQAFLSAVFCLHQICSSSITQFSPLLLFPITK